MKNYYYFISFVYTDEQEKHKFGNCEIALNFKLTQYSEINVAKNEIQGRCHHLISIISWIYLREEKVKKLPFFLRAAREFIEKEEKEIYDKI